MYSSRKLLTFPNFVLMNLTELIFLSFGLAFDAFAVSIVSGTRSDIDNPKARFRMSFHFGLFQLIMPIIGWFLGFQIAFWFSSIDHWIAFAILIYIGYKMITESKSEDSDNASNNPSKGKKLILLSIATSIDALAVGFSLAMLKVDVLFPALCIGIITGILSLVGIYIGKYFGMKFSKYAKISGGLILIFIGIKIVLEHTFFQSLS